MLRDDVLIIDKYEARMNVYVIPEAKKLREEWIAEVERIEEPIIEGSMLNHSLNLEWIQLEKKYKALIEDAINRYINGEYIT